MTLFEGKSLRLLSAVMSGLLVANSPIASAAPMVGSHDTTTVSVIGGSFPRELSASDAARLAKMASGSKARGSGNIVHAAAFPVTHSWLDKDRKLVVLRSNIESKVVTKHNLTWQAVRTSTQYPKSKVQEKAGGTTYKYETPVQRIECKGRWIFKKCRVVQTVTLRTVVDFRKADSNPMGVVSSYCLGSTRCPDYVKNALNVRR